MTTHKISPKIAVIIFTVCYAIFPCPSKSNTPTEKLLKVDKVQSDKTGYHTEDKIPGDVDNGIKILRRVYNATQKYRTRHEDQYPKEQVGLKLDMLSNFKEYGFVKANDVFYTFLNPDNSYDDSDFVREAPNKYSMTVIFHNRADGGLLGSVKSSGTSDVLAYMETYFHKNGPLYNGKLPRNPVGFYLVGWDDGRVEKVPYDRALKKIAGEQSRDVFVGQAGVPWNTVSYQELWAYIRGDVSTLAPIGYPINPKTKQPNVDNGTYESIVSLSRLLNAPDEREPIWNALGRNNNVFTLKQTREGAAKLKLPLTQKKLTLAQLQALRSPAVLQMRGDIIAQNPLNPRPNVASLVAPTISNSRNRVVTLAQSDIEYSIVQDAGMTRIVKTAELAKLYSGEALVPQAASAPSALKIDNAVRVVAFKSKSDEVTQTVKLTNTSKKPLTLEIERPIPGVTKAELSSKSLAAGESATLTLSIKWREVLPGDVQQVFVTLKTSDAVQPRAMLGFRLEAPPAPPLNVSPSGTPPQLP